MTPEDYRRLDAVALAGLVQRGEVDPVDLVDLALGRIAALDPAIGAVVALDPEGARAAARQVSRSLPLAGVPFLVKDTNVDVAGFPTRHGSKFFAEAPAAARDSEIVRRWRAAGVIILGKTKTPEFAADFTTEPRWLGPARNPWNRERSTGGSSGGAAAAIAAGMVPAAHGTDCGGSIRVPAAWCGVIGLKPTRGRMPVGPDVSEFVSGLDVEHVLTRSVRDCAAFLDAGAGLESGAPYDAPPGPTQCWRDALALPRRRLRIAVTVCRPDGSAIAPVIAAAVDRLAGGLTGAGHATVPFVWPDLAGADDAAAVFWQLEIARLIEDRARAMGRPPQADEIEPLSRYSWERGRATSGLDFIAARSVQNRIARAMAEAFAAIDVLLLPTTSELPPALGTFGAGSDDFDRQRWCDAAYGHCPFTEIFNLTGQPAIAIPIGLSDDGLPLGVQLAGKFGDEATLLGLAQQLADDGILKLLVSPS